MVVDSREFRKLFFKRIKLDEKEKVEFTDLPEIMKAFAYRFPFENLDLIDGSYKPITKDQVIKKVLVDGQGGLCYYLNTLFYYFLKEYGFNVKFLAARVKDPIDGAWGNKNGHVIVSVEYQDKLYIVDVGFGLFLAFQPIPYEDYAGVDGTFKFRFVKAKTEYGEYSLEMLKKNKETTEEYWECVYAMENLDDNDMSLSDEAQNITITDPSKKFSVHPLLARIQKEGINAVYSGTDNTLNLSTKDSKLKLNIPYKSQTYNETLTKYFR